MSISRSYAHKVIVGVLVALPFAVSMTPAAVAQDSLAAATKKRSTESQRSTRRVSWPILEPC